MLQSIFVIALFLANPSSSIVLHGYKAVNPAWNITLDLTIVKNSTADNVLIEMQGPTDRWFGIGFGANQMSGTYAITSTGSTGVITERKLGNHEQGTTLQSSVTVLSNVNNGNGFRTVKLSRSVQGPSSNYYTFPTSATSINLICARGDSSGATTLAFHGDSNHHNGVQISLQFFVLFWFCFCFVLFCFVFEAAVHTYKRITKKKKKKKVAH
ncbi:hypothetical protein RFI_05507 [Reticulomyxa filosa]|uniref:DOMON domain-containing protein n=1 Tax=Reticulomyxa filosa TaxID=46433 RepID=X6P0L0_RETFI|nr:hypothetical protein RFI_05507 [Reticulomyxa filosa]|eukprot:ETO31614.1 hypothetical protein RFI_05507 [Reticulomyxa filosa]